LCNAARRQPPGKQQALEGTSRKATGAKRFEAHASSLTPLSSTGGTPARKWLRRETLLLSLAPEFIHGDERNIWTG